MRRSSRWPTSGTNSAIIVAMDGLSFSVARGEIVSLLGRTGAGKSTILNLIMGTMPPTAGQVRVAGAILPRFQGLRGKLAVSFQTDRLLPWRNAVENAELGLLILGVSAAEARAKRLHGSAVSACKARKQICARVVRRHAATRVARPRARHRSELVLLDKSFSQLDHLTSTKLRMDFSASQGRTTRRASW